MNAEQFFNNGFGDDVEKVHRKHVIDLMTNFAKHYHTEQCNIANVSKIVTCYTCNCTKGKEPEGDNYCNMCDHYF